MALASPQHSSHQKKTCLWIVCILKSFCPNKEAFTMQTNCSTVPIVTQPGRENKSSAPAPAPDSFCDKHLVSWVVTSCKVVMQTSQLSCGMACWTGLPTILLHSRSSSRSRQSCHSVMLPSSSLFWGTFLCRLSFCTHTRTGCNRACNANENVKAKTNLDGALPGILKFGKKFYPWHTIWTDPSRLYDRMAAFSVELVWPMCVCRGGGGYWYTFTLLLWWKNTAPRQDVNAWKWTCFTFKQTGRQAGRIESWRDWKWPDVFYQTILTISLSLN